jgi:5-methylcytosine-specific restriction endonuclease McrA
MAVFLFYRRGMVVELGRKRGGTAYRQSLKLKEYIRERDNYTCQICGKEGWIVDHIVPWRVSHDSTVSNMRVLCHRCNLATKRERDNALLPEAEWWQHIEQEAKAEREPVYV